MHFLGKWIAAAAIVVLTGATYAPPAAETLSVTISGAGKARANVPCTWQANVTGGTGNYTLAWSGGINGTPFGTDQYAATTPASGIFYITVTVTDNISSETDTATKPVMISSTAGPCLV